MTTGTLSAGSAGLIDHQAQESTRVLWVDYAKGICIVAVVMMYATHHVQQILRSEGWMEYVVRFAQPFRMPDFFMIGGLFVARVIDRPWRRYIDSKVLYFIYFYTIWVSFRFSYTDLREAVNEGTVLTEYLRLFLAPPSGPLWFIYILALFFIAVRLVRGWRPGLVLALSAGLHVADLHTGVTLFDKFSQYFIFFYGGHLLARHVFSLAAWSQHHLAFAPPLLAAWFVLNGWAVFTGVAALPGVSLLLGFGGAIAVMLAAVLCSRVTWLDWLRWLGRHSIVIYLGFVIPLGVLRIFIHRSAGIVDPGTVALATTIGSIAGAVLLYQAVRRTPLRFLFARPAWTHLSPPAPARERA
ncbi:acyltransferase family protein [Noviherbaspirillum aridicola]|uniref:acyltransferase family protein n=1 Tax=Noviherbaspirillum aridicola TaxID=2849687 RepID=UPI001C80FA4C|nr:acyltransferase family protein [Noviherbaspirillum aridicola]